MKDRVNLSLVLKRVDQVLAGERQSVMDEVCLKQIGKKGVSTKSPSRFISIKKTVPYDNHHKSPITKDKRMVHVKDLIELNEAIRYYWRQLQLNEQQLGKLQKDYTQLCSVNISLNSSVTSLKKELSFAEWKCNSIAGESKQLGAKCQKYQKDLDDAKAESLNLIYEMERLRDELKDRESRLQSSNSELAETRQLIGERSKRPKVEVDLTFGLKGENLLQGLVSDDCSKEDDELTAGNWVMWSPIKMDSENLSLQIQSQPQPSTS